MSCDAVAANKAFHEKFDFAFPLLSDVDKSMTKAFGVCKPAKDGSDPCDTVWKSTRVSGASRRRRGRPGLVERRGIGIASPSSRRRVDGVQVDATIQNAP